MEVTSENRDKASLDIFWIRDESLKECEQGVQQELVEEFESALERFRENRDRF